MQTCCVNTVRLWRVCIKVTLVLPHVAHTHKFCPYHGNIYGTLGRLNETQLFKQKVKSQTDQGMLASKAGQYLT